ncbi:MAG: hypothetical protein WCC32_08985 [Terriglobales bacterium]
MCVEANVYAEFLRVIGYRPQSVVRIPIVQILRECSRGAGFRLTSGVDGHGWPPLNIIPWIVTLYIVIL